jgi:hypothetical protein
MATLLEISCACGYTTRAAEGGLFAGVVSLFICADCLELVGELTWASRWSDRPPGPVIPRCHLCGRGNLEPWSSPGACPRCGETVEAESVGIAD